MKLSAIACVLICAVKFVNSFARRRHLFDIAAKPTHVDSTILSYPAPLSLVQFCPNNIFMVVIRLPPVNFINISLGLFLRSELGTRRRTKHDIMPPLHALCCRGVKSKNFPTVNSLVITAAAFDVRKRRKSWQYDIASLVRTGDDWWR